VILGEIMKMRPAYGSLVLLSSMLAACGGDGAPAGSGSLRVVAAAEDTITGGIAAGTGEEEIRDGWSVGFEKYIAVLGDIDIHLATDEKVEGKDANIFAVDLAQAPSAGFELWKLEELPEGRYEFNYWLSGGAHAERHESVSESDFARLEADDLSYLISGILQKTDGVSCPPKSKAAPGDAEPTSTSAAGDDCYENPSITFEFAVSAETSFGPCEIDGLAGVVISPDKTQTSTITIHGDHLFFNGFPEGDEGGVVRNAQWLADSDLNVDGKVTREELESLVTADLAALSGIQLGGAPIEIDSVWAYATAQLKTQGHYQGEGECAVDGKAHSHE